MSKDFLPWGDPQAEDGASPLTVTTSFPKADRNTLGIIYNKDHQQEREEQQHGKLSPQGWLLDCDPQEEIILQKPNNDNNLSDERSNTCIKKRVGKKQK